MTDRRQGPSPAVRFLFSLLLRLQPRSIRSRFGDEMRQYFLDDYQASVGGGAMSSARFLVRTCAGMLVSGIGARLERSAPPASTRGVNAPPVGTPGELAGDVARTIRHAARGLARSPGFSLTSVLTLGLGLGACTTIFCVIHPVLIAPLPYPEAHEIVALQEKAPEPEGRTGWVSPLTYRDWEERSQHLEEMAAWRLSILTWTGRGEARVVDGWAVSAGYFSLLGHPMALGRGFTAEEDAPGGGRAVVLSHGLWARDFGFDPSVLGQPMTLDGEAYTVVGVAPPGLGYPSGGDYFVPLALDYGRELRDFRYLGVLGRVAEGSTLEDARADLRRMAAQVAAEHPDTNAGWSAEATPLKEVLVGSLRPVLSGMAAAVGLLLLIALGNVANLSVARSVGRQTESAVRRALGASRGHLARRYLVEGLMLSTVGSLLGLGIAVGAVRVMTGTVLASLPRAQDITVDGGVMVFAAGTAVLVGLLLGVSALVVPAGATLSGTLRAGGGGGTEPARAHRMREAVLATQVALALALVIGASLLTRSLLALGSVDLGFQPEELLTFSFDLPEGAYGDAESVRGFYRNALAAIREIPGVQAAGAVTPMPMELGSVPSSWSLAADVRPSDPVVMAHMRTATPGYFDAMGIPVLRGRAFGEGDQDGSQPVALVNEAFVSEYLGGHDPLGARVTPGEPDDEESAWLTIVGVVADVRFQSLRSAGGEPEIYLPAQQLPSGWGHLVVRAGGPEDRTVRAVTAAVQGLDSDLPLASVRTGEDIVGRYLATSRLSATLSAVFAATATLLAVVGIVGVLSLTLAQRLREIGLRMVLGAAAGSIRRFALARAMRPVVLGLALGLALSMAASRLLESQVFGVDPVDPLTYVLATLGFAGASLLACLIPSARAAAADPLTLLRME